MQVRAALELGRRVRRRLGVLVDRRKVRDGLAKLKATKGLLGDTKRTDDREADKPYLFVQARGGNWTVMHNPL